MGSILCRKATPRCPDSFERSGREMLVSMGYFAFLAEAPRRCRGHFAHPGISDIASITREHLVDEPLVSFGALRGAWGRLPLHCFPPQNECRLSYQPGCKCREAFPGSTRLRLESRNSEWCNLFFDCPPHTPGRSFQDPSVGSRGCKRRLSIDGTRRQQPC